MRKLFFSLLLISSAQVNAYDTKVDGIYYNLDPTTKTASVTHGDVDYEAGIAEHYVGDIIIPEYITVNDVNYEVIDIGYYAFSESDKLTSVSIPKTVKTIGESFRSCIGLTSIVIPDGVQSIGEYAFFGCSGLTSVTISPSVKYINEYAFGYCENATDLIYAEGCTTTLATHLSYLTSVTIPQTVTSIADSAFQECSYLTEVTLPEGVVSIGREAFSWCLSLSSINLPDAVTHIGQQAFNACESLPVEDHIRYVGRYLVGVDDDGHYETSLNIRPGTEWIGDYAFVGCIFLPAITLPDGVKHIGISAFESCLALESFSIPSSVTTIESLAYARCESFTSVTIPASLTTIAENAFADCVNIRKLIYAEGCTTTFCLMLPSITSAILPSTLTSIGHGTFQKCENLTSVTLPKGVTRIGDFAFDGCIALPKINIPSLVTSIGDYAFVGCGALTSIILPELLDSIGTYAFADCNSLAQINIPQSVCYIGDDAFLGCQSLPIEDGIRYADTYLIEPIDRQLQTTRIREGTRWIGTRAFKTCTELSIIKFPSSLEYIETEAFSWCLNLKASNTYDMSIQLPNHLKVIKEFAFYYCPKLAEVTIPQSVASIGYSAFSSCESLNKVKVEWSNPLPLSDYVFLYSPIAGATLYVPTGTKDKYASATTWSEFGVIKEYAFSDISKVSVESLSIPQKTIQNGRVIIRNFGHSYNIDGTLLQ